MDVGRPKIMRKTTDSFSFDLPDEWRTFKDGTRLVAQGTGGEELILSSWFVKIPQGAPAAAVERVVDQLFENARVAAERTAEDPELNVTRAFSQDINAGGLFPCWTLVAESRDLFFGEAVIRGPRTVMLVTFEAPNAPTRRQELAAFLRSFGSAQN